MSYLVESDPVETLEFKWGKKRGRGVKNKKIQFYESFTYDGVDYTLYDYVHLYKEGEPEPYIGKLVSISENDDTKAKGVKVHWFFRPSEISNWIEEGMALDNEIFLASGEGVCAASFTPLEAISGKCNVVCTSQDERNSQPSAQELELADYFFYRTFDVEHCTISDIKGDKVAGLEVKFLFNRKENKNNIGPISDKKQEGIKPTSFDAINSSDLARSSFQSTLSRVKDTSLIGGSENIEIGKANVSRNKAGIEEKVKVAKGSGPLQNRFPNKSVVVGSETLQKNKNTNSLGTLNLVDNDTRPLTKSYSFTDKMKNGEQRVSTGIDKVVKADKSAYPITKHEKKETSQKLLASSDKNGGKDLASNSFTDKRKDYAGLDKEVKVEKSVIPLTKPENKENRQKLFANSDKNGGKDLVTSFRKRKYNHDLGPDKDPKVYKTEEKMTKLSNEMLPKVSTRDSAREERSEFGELEVTRRPIDERSKWFRALPWEERIKSAYEQGTVIQLSNLDPKYTSSEIEDLIWHAFKEHCTAKMVQCTANSSPYNGHAYIIMKTRQATDLVIKELEDGCLMLPNKRPLVASRAPPLNFPGNGKQSPFTGHLSVDKMKHQRQRETTEAVSTSHFSQPNTIEYEMALEWCLLQSRTDRWGNELNKQQGGELKKLKANLKLE